MYFPIFLNFCIFKNFEKSSEIDVRDININIFANWIINCVILIYFICIYDTFDFLISFEVGKKIFFDSAAVWLLFHDRRSLAWRNHWSDSKQLFTVIILHFRDKLQSSYTTLLLCAWHMYSKKMCCQHNPAFRRWQHSQWPCHMLCSWMCDSFSISWREPATKERP